MEFRNLTPFDALCFSALDPNDDEHKVIVMKVGFRLIPQADGSWRADLIEDPPVPLCLGDEFFGEPGESSVRQESDLAPYKPRCDVLVIGHAYAPGGKPSAHWETRLRVSLPPGETERDEPDAPQPLNPMMGLTDAQREQWQRDKQRAAQSAASAAAAEHVLLDKRLTMLGPYGFTQRFLLPGWRRSRVMPIARLALRWEHAFGGSSVVRDRRKPDGKTLLDEVCFSNPVGRGWVERREAGLARKAGQPRRRVIDAPQIVPSGKPLAAPVLVSHPKGEQNARQMAERARGYGVQPAGYGPVGRAWAPRLALAGTYDDTWLQQRHPGLPADIDFRYWNCAPEDQQLPYLPPTFRLQAWNLTSPTQGNGHLDVTLPGHRAFLLMRLESGVVLPLPMITDTAILDTDEMTLTLTHRSWIPAATPPVRVLEARYEADPAAPLIRRAPAVQEA